MSDNNKAEAHTPNIQDKLLHLGFEACASDASVFARSDLQGLKIVLDQKRIHIRHEDGNGAALHEAFMHQQSALNNTQLEQHVRGAFSQVFGHEAAREITNYPYSEQRVAKQNINLP